MAAPDPSSGCARDCIFLADFRWFSRIRAKINENLREKAIIAPIFARKRENQRESQSRTPWQTVTGRHCYLGFQTVFSCDAAVGTVVDCCSCCSCCWRSWFHQTRKLLDGFCSFLDIFLLIHRNNCMQSAVSLQALFFFCYFLSFAWDIEIFTSECTLCVSQHSFSWNQQMDFVRFWIYSCLYIVVTVCKTPFCYKHYFLHFSNFRLGLKNIY